MELERRLQERLEATQMSRAQIQERIQEANKMLQQLQQNQSELYKAMVEHNAVIAEFEVLLAAEKEDASVNQS